LTSVGARHVRRESIAGRLRRHRQAIAAALAVVFLITVLCTVDTSHWTNLLSRDQGSSDHWTFAGDRSDTADALAGFDTIYRGGNESQLALTPRGLALGTATEDNSALYLQRRLPGAVNRIGITANFDVAPPGVPGAVALIVAADSIPPDVSVSGAGFPNLGIHFVFDRESWLVAVWGRGGSQEVLDKGRFVPPLAGDRSVDITRTGDDVVIALPNGKVRNVSDRRVGDWSGTWANWELHEATAGRTPALIRQIWAGWAD
jgi:hypothetical protein